VEDFVLCKPEIRITTVDPERDDFFLLASDGLFDRFSSEDCIEQANKHFLKQGGLTEQDPQIVAQRLVRDATRHRVNSDNTTCIVVCLNNGIEPVVEPADLT
jgi:serine/threonine protein phosphatase PrpC